MSRILAMRFPPIVAAMLSGCSGAIVEPFDLSGSKSDGVIVIGANVGEFDEINWNGADIKANARCIAWGYASSEAFEGIRTTCTQPGGWFGCAQREISRAYQCLD